jgi:hypothetical protein
MWQLWIYGIGCVVTWVIAVRFLHWDKESWDWYYREDFEYYITLAFMGTMIAVVWPFVLAGLLLIGLTIGVTKI